MFETRQGFINYVKAPENLLNGQGRIVCGRGVNPCPCIYNQRIDHLTELPRAKGSLNLSYQFAINT